MEMKVKGRSKCRSSECMADIKAVPPSLRSRKKFPSTFGVSPPNIRNTFRRHPAGKTQVLSYRNECRKTLTCAVKMTDRAATDAKPKCTPAELMLKVILTGTLSHYETRGMIDETRLEHMLAAGKSILYKTHQESDVRYVNGYSTCLPSFVA